MSGLFYVRAAALACFLLVVSASIWTVGYEAYGVGWWAWPVVVWVFAAVYGAVCFSVSRMYRRSVYLVHARERASQRLLAPVSSVHVLTRARYEARLAELWAEEDENLRHSLRVLDGGAS